MGPVSYTHLADIGTDHGYVPVCLLQSGKIPFAVAVDVHKGPLESAMNNASRCGVADKMHFVCGDGLHGVLPDEAEDIVIAGMGGELILRIISEAPWLCTMDTVSYTHLDVYKRQPHGCRDAPRAFESAERNYHSP